MPVAKICTRMILSRPTLPAYIGMFIPIVLNAFGTAISISIIGKSTGGASVNCPRVFTKSLIGIVICEANLIFSFLIFFFLGSKMEAILATQRMTKVEIQSIWAVFTSGLVSGVCGMTASLGSAVVNAAATIAIASNPKIFSKLVTLQLIVGGVGPLGLIIAIVVLRASPIASG